MNNLEISEGIVGYLLAATAIISAVAAASTHSAEFFVTALCCAAMARLYIVLFHRRIKTLFDHTVEANDNQDSPPDNNHG